MLNKWKTILCAVLILIPAAAVAEADDPVVAIVGSEEILQSELDQARDLKMSYAKGRSTPKMDMRRLLDEIIEIKLLAQEGRRLGLDKDASVQYKIKNLVEGIIADEYKTNLASQIKTGEEECKAYYEEHPARFTRPERRNVRHIAVATEEEAEAVLAELKKGANFEEMAKKKSIVKTRGVGGGLGWVTKGLIHSELETVAFKMKAGDISDPIAIEGNYHIITVEGIQEEEKQSYEESKQRIKKMLEQEKTKKAYLADLERLKKDLGVQILLDEQQQ